MRRPTSSALRRALPAALLLAAFALRLYRLDAQDIWGDEAWSIAITAAPLRASLFMEANPPAYFLFLRGARALWGSTPFALRYLSVLCGLLVVAQIGALGRRAGGRAVGAAALTAAAVNPFLVYYAQEARMYGPVLVGGAGSLYWFARLTTRGRGAPLWQWALYTLFTLTAVFSHYYAFAVPLAQALYLAGAQAWAVWRRAPRPSVRLWLAVWLGMALLFLPYFWQHRQVWGNQTDRRFAEWRADQLLSIGERTLIAYGAGTTLHADQRPWGWAVVGLAAVGAVRLARRRPATAGLLALAVGTGIALAWALTPLLPFFWERYLLAGLPPFLALVGAGLANWPRGPRGPSLVWLPLGLLLAVNGVGLANYYGDPAFVKGGYGRLMQAIASAAQPGDLIALNGPLQMSLFDYYRPPDLPFVLLPRDQLLTDADAARVVSATTVGYARVWLVEAGNPAEYDPLGRARGALAQVGSFARKLERPGVTAWLFVLQEPQAAEIALEANLGDLVTLRGFATADAQPAPGDVLLVTLFWEAQRPIERAYTVFVHLIGPDGRLVAQADGEPVGGSRPTTGWQPGETIRDGYALPLPADLPPGRYLLQAGLYAWPELTRLPWLRDGRLQGDAVPLQEVVVHAPDAP